jgi:hypothetical protein
MTAVHSIVITGDRADAERFARGAVTQLRLQEQRLVEALRTFARGQLASRLAAVAEASRAAHYACDLSAARGAAVPHPEKSIDRIARTRGDCYRVAIAALGELAAVDSARAADADASTPLTTKEPR